MEYIYDVFDRRIGRKLDTSSPFDMADAVIERYVLDDIHNGLVSLDGGNVVLDFVDPDGSGGQPMAMSKRYLYGEAVDQLFAQEDLSKTLGDTSSQPVAIGRHLGTVRDLAKQDGTIAVHYQYDSFGNVTSGDTSKTRYLFTSREFDTATDLQYNRARWYDAGVGRWISEDPIGFVAGDANVARYVGNGVTGAADPSGQQPPDTVMDRRLGIQTLPRESRQRRYPGSPDGSWTPRQFFGLFSPLVWQTGWGCGGMAAWRAGAPVNPIGGRYDPMDIPKIPGAREFATWPQVRDARRASGGTGIIIAVQSNYENWKLAPGPGNFATYFETYWEYANHGDSTPGRKIIHSPNLPGGFKFTTYILVPRQ